MSKCSICPRPDRPSIDAQLIAGKPRRTIARYLEGVSKDSLARHFKHVGQAIVKAAERRGERLGDGLLDQQRGLNRRALSLLDDSENADDGRLRAVAIALVRENIIAEAKLITDSRSAGLDGQRFEISYVDWLTGERIVETFEKPDLGNAQLVGRESLGTPTFSPPSKASAEIVAAAVAVTIPESNVAVSDTDAPLTLGIIESIEHAGTINPTAFSASVDPE
jgi:hypothetical protein